jgi:trimeric autotransporter adhesin
MPRRYCHVFLLLSVLSLVLCGCGGFKGILTPTLSSIDPTSVAAGSGDFTLTATGTNFDGGTTILWGGIALPTTVSSSTQLRAKIAATQIAAAGAVSIRVMKSDSTTSGAITLTITGGSPGGSFSLTSISPAAVAAGSPDFTLTATGAGFVSGAAITLNGAAIATTFDSATQLHGTIPASNVAAATTITVGVTNPDKSTTNTLPLTVFASSGLGPAPTLTSISPNKSPNAIGTSPLSLTATGTNFVSGSTIMWSGVAMTTTFVSSTQLTATIPPKYINLPASAFDQATGIATANVFVLNPDSTVSNELPFTITISPSTTPTLVTVFNQQGTQRSEVGDPGFTMTLCGSLFANGGVAYWNGVALPTSQATPASAPCPATAPQQVTAQASASMLTAVAEIPITIKNANSNPSNSIPYYVGMNIYFDESADVVWDSRFNLLYISKPSTAQHSQDSIIAFSTRTGLNDAAAVWIYSLPAGSNPDRLALSADKKYLYVGLDGSGAVQQLTITGATTAPTAGNPINLGSDPQYGKYYALDMQVSPLSNTTIAVTRGVPPGSRSPARAIGGLAIYDNGTQRPQVVGPSAAPSSDALLDTLQWSADGNTIYAANNENASGDLYQLPVTATGVTLPAGNDHGGIFNVPNLYIHLNPASGWLYGDDGTVVDPVTATGKGNTLASGVMTPDPLPSPGTGYGYYLAHPSADPNVLEYFILTYDLTSLAPGPSLDLYQVQGIPQHLIRWNDSSDGTQGLAFTTQKFNCLYSPCNVGDGRFYVVNLPLP